MSINLHSKFTYFYNFCADSISVLLFVERLIISRRKYVGIFCFCNRYWAIGQNGSAVAEIQTPDLSVSCIPMNIDFIKINLRYCTYCDFYFVLLYECITRGIIWIIYFIIIIFLWQPFLYSRNSRFWDFF